MAAENFHEAEETQEGKYKIFPPKYKIFAKCPIRKEKHFQQQNISNSCFQGIILMQNYEPEKNQKKIRIGLCVPKSLQEKM